MNLIEFTLKQSVHQKTTLTALCFVEKQRALPSKAKYASEIFSRTGKSVGKNLILSEKTW